MEDYVVRYGGDLGDTNRSLYMTKNEAEKFYLNLKLDTAVTWKELLYEPIEEDDSQYIVKSESVSVVDLGLCKIALPNAEVIN